MRWFKSLFAKPEVVKGTIAPCCADQRNREVVKRGVAKQPNGRELPTEVTKCVECDRRHYRLFVGEQLKPGQVGIK